MWHVKSIIMACTKFILALLAAAGGANYCLAFSNPPISISGRTAICSAVVVIGSDPLKTSLKMAVEPPPGGISATVEDAGDAAVDSAGGQIIDGGAKGGEMVSEFFSPTTSTATTATSDASTPPATSSSSIDATKRVGINSRGAKMNEIDFTLAPTDVSLSRCYQMSEQKESNATEASSEATTNSAAQKTSAQQSLSLTRALNVASNRAVRRILLSRSWPSAEALNLSLRTVLMQQKKEEEDVVKAGLVPNQQSQKEGESSGAVSGEGESDKMKCPVPRPILNVIMNRRGGTSADAGSTEGEGAIAASSDDDTGPVPTTTEEREEAWIQNQIAVFRDSYSVLPGYDQAEAYLESILCLATSGEESVRVAEVMEGGVYVQPYVRLLSVIQSVGVVLEEIPDSEGLPNFSIRTLYLDGSSKEYSRRRIAKKLIDQDICLSMLDKIALANERKRKDIVDDDEDDRGRIGEEKNSLLAIPYDAAARLAYDADPNNRSMSFEEFREKYAAETVAMVSAKWEKMNDGGEQSAAKREEVEEEEEPKGAYEKGRKRRLKFWSRDRKFIKDDEGEDGSVEASVVVDSKAECSANETTPPSIVIKPDDLGGVLLSAEEPSMTRQLNVLSNIVQRTLIFGGDQELLVLAETLDADRPAFIQRWYKDDAGEDVDDVQSETRPGAQYLNSLIQILRDCYTKGVLKEITPTLPLTTAYSNAYGRLTASLIELGSGYVRPSTSSSLSLAMTTTAATAKYLTSTSPPQTVREELGRFAKWESAVRKNRENPYPDDLVGTWNVQDVVGTQTIGTTEVTFKPQGELSVKPPMQGLRWRLDPGPTHLDTCTFQVLSDDGAILQYKGYVDRGSRLEARVSKRAVTMRGGVSFLMRDAEGSGGSFGDDYWDDMLPMNYKSGTTKFIMTRDVDGSAAIVEEYSSGSTGARTDLKCPPVVEGEREILDGPSGPILVTQVAGSYYAVDATCPHLNLPMKKGKITIEEGKEPTLTCSFHNSCFEMKTGKCTQWVTGALGTENELIADIMSNLGSEKKDIVTYHVTKEEDGSLRVTSEVPEASKIAA